MTPLTSLAFYKIAFLLNFYGGGWYELWAFSQFFCQIKKINILRLEGGGMGGVRAVKKNLPVF